MDNKPLTEAEQEYLVALNTQVQNGQMALQNFLAFLRKQHEAPATEWELGDIRVGFTRAKDAPPRKAAPAKSSRRRSRSKPKPAEAEESKQK